jgi:hypothetical protein
VASQTLLTLCDSESLIRVEHSTEPVRPIYLIDGLTNELLSQYGARGGLGPDEAPRFAAYRPEIDGGGPVAT